MKKEFFYVTSDRTGIKLRCVTPLYCNNSIQHKNHEHTKPQSISQSLVFLCFRGSKSITMLQHERLETWFEFETGDAITTLVQVLRRKERCHYN